MPTLREIIQQQQGVIQILTEKLTKQIKNRKAPKELHSIDSPLVYFCFDMERKRIVFHLKNDNVKVAKHYKSSHALRIMHGRIVRDPNGDYARECIAQAHWGLLKPTKDNYPL